MDIELIDRTWACLPKEFKEKVKKKYARCVKIDEDDNPNLPAYAVKSAITRRALLEKLFGEHNLTSDTEEEEMLTVPRKKVEEKWQRAYEQEAKYSRAQDSSVARLELYYNRGILSILDTLFGSKCLPDELNEDNFAKSEPKPSEPKNEGTRQEQCVPKNAESGTHSFNHILKDGFHDHNRLYIAAMAMQGILSNADRMKGYEHVATTPPCEELTVVVARNALRYADALIKKVEGDSK